jgi:clan AA aspartic protease
MTGSVNENLEALVEMTIVLADGERRPFKAAVDTGFNGFLTLPMSLIASMDLSWLFRQEGLLADGTTHTFDVYVATVEWQGSLRAIEVEAAEAQPLLGMALMLGSELRIQVIPGGSATLAPLVASKD